MTSPLVLWRDRTDHEIASVLAALSGPVTETVPAATEMLTPLKRYANGGKRLRALLLLASHRAHRGVEEEAAVSLAAALEFFQTAALIHDDVLDGSDTRRGGPAAHRAIAHLHAERGWDGSSDEFGAAGAVLAGDLALMACQRAVGRACARLGARGEQLAAFFSDMTDLVTAGQYADMRAAAQPLSSLGDQGDDIETVMRAKTASYSAEYPLALGAAVAGADPASMGALQAAGRDLGIAFQLRDDILGLVGTPATTGKPAGDDIREGKRTALVWHAWRHGGDATRTALASTMGRREATDTEVAAAVDAVVATGALDAAERRIESLTSSARGALAARDLDPQGTRLLDDLITTVVDRVA
ncbi:polyprenyl synthetase family protein [Demequina sp. NBRC 110051]|uniref:polyprenyl synthetase family protein n=1 Tax=Demequina sp. NBRC 110051 TaxID=1570340 RepID=UPI00117F50AB|nr:polyprenyl synthetase family protein [Demequina sp. NBRC 110051]